MPESKLAEKLGFRVTENGDVVNLTAKFLDAPKLRELGSEKYARLALWNLCLELSERLERAEKIETQRNKLFDFVTRFHQAHYKYVPNIMLIEAEELVGAKTLAAPERKDA